MTAVIHRLGGQHGDQLGGQHGDQLGGHHVALESERDTALSSLHHGIGYGHGYRAGYEAGYATCDEQWQKIMGVYSEAITRTPLNRVTPGTVAASGANAPEARSGANAQDLSGRTNVAPPCPAKCGACSTCTRSKTAWANKRSTGSFDHAGGPVPSW